MALAARDLFQLNKLLDTALSLAPGERLSWIDALDAENEQFKGILQELLARDDCIETRGFLGTLPKLTGTPFRGYSGVVAGDEIGSYRLERQIGAGGMATVWLAERTDGLLKRKVALKLPHIGAVLPGLAERMTRERNILAALEHPNIARLYDAGIAADGRPYLALEYVEGVPIDKYCESTSADLADRLRLLVQAARAVAFAHAHLVVHRDLKPSNIQVDERGRVHLLDFGIAKLLDESAGDAPLTRAATALTPEYASPEQARGESVSTASDVYSLGVVLYELLARKALHEVSRAAGTGIAQGEVVRPSEIAVPADLRRSLRGDLDTIVLKALKHEPAERYATMAEFADDLERYLRHEPVLARRDSAWYRARKFVRRHRVAVGAGAVAILALIVALGMAAWEARIAREHAAIAQRETTRARVVQGFLTDLFNANTDAQSDPLHARQMTARDLLDRGAARVGVALRDSPEAQDEVLTTLSDMYRAVGADEQAAILEHQRLEVQRRLYGEHDLRYADALINYVQYLEPTGDRLEAPRLLGQAKAIIDADANVPPLLRARLYEGTARTNMYVAITRMRDNAHAAADIIRKSGLSTFEYGAILRLEARANTWLGNWPEAVALHERSLAENAKFAPAGLGLTVTDMLELADVHTRMANVPTAEQLYRDVLKLSQARNGEAHVDTIQVETRFASFLHDTARLAESRALQDAAMRHARESSEADTPSLVAQMRRDLAGRLLDDGRLEEVTPLVAAQVEMRRKLYPDSITLANALYDQARLELALGQYAQSERTLDEGLTMLRAALGPGRQPVTDNRFRLLHAQLLLATGRAPAAVTESRDVLGTRLPAGTTLALDHIAARNILAAAYLDLGDARRALDESSAALGELRGSPMREFYQRLEADAELRFGQAQLRLGNSDNALPALEHALALRRANVDANSPAVEEAELALADCLTTLKQTQRARTLRSEASAVRTAHTGVGVELPKPPLR